MKWKDYLEPTEKSAGIFLSLLKDKWGHIPAKKDGIFLGGIHVTPRKCTSCTTVDIDIEDESNLTQLSLIEQALEDTGYAGMAFHMMDYFAAVVEETFNHEFFNHSLGSTSGITGERPWDGKKQIDVSILTSIESSVGCAEGIVHELAHYKNHAVGIGINNWDESIIKNTHDELFHSPVRFDSLRPMGAVIHAEFSYVYVTDFYNRIFKFIGSEKEYLGYSLQALHRKQAYNIKRIGNGIHTIQENIKIGDQEFYDEFMKFALSVYNEAKKYIPTGDPTMDWKPDKGDPK